MANFIQGIVSAIPDRRTSRLLRQVFDQILPTQLDINITASTTQTQAGAKYLNPLCNFHEVTTIGTANDTVALPPAVFGQMHFVKNSHASKAMQVYGVGTDTIDSVATATGVSQLAGEGVLYVCVVNGNYIRFRGNGATTTFTSLVANDITGGDASLDILGFAAAQGGDVVMTGGTSSTAGNAGGVSKLVGGTPGSTGIGGVVSAIAGAGGSASGAGGAASFRGGAGTAGNAAGGAVDLTSGAGQGSANSGTVTVASGVAGATGASGAISITSGTAAGGASGAVTVTTGAATGGIPGTATLSAGSAQTAATAGGAIAVTGGAGNTSGAGGAITVTSGAAGSSGTSGAITISSGTAAGGATGTVTVTSGAATGGVPGTVTVSSGNAQTAATAGGAVAITGGVGNTSGAGGAVTITSGAAGSTGVAGTVTVQVGAATAGNGSALLLKGGAGAGGGTQSGGNIDLTAGAAQTTGTPGEITVNNAAGLSEVGWQQYLGASVPVSGTSYPFFMANRAYRVKAVSVYQSSAVTPTVNIIKDTSTNAPGAGTAVLTGAITFGAANTRVVGNLSATVATLTLAAGDRLTATWGGTIGALTGALISVLLVPV